jgi:hypothetical protein
MDLIALSNDDTFLKHSKELAKKIERAISTNYLINNEVTIVRKIVDEINATTMDTRSVSKTIISTRAIFIHGYKVAQLGSNPSGVEFERYGLKTNKELSDIIFEVEIIGKRSSLQKVTFNQVKKSSTTEKSQTWNIDKEQLYLLSRFPSFKGVQGSIVPQTSHNLANNSDNLGSYGLLYDPGGFVYISAVKLNNILKDKKSVNQKELFEFAFRYDENDVQNKIILGDLFVSNDNDYFAGDIYNFIKKYMLCSIGETVNSSKGIVNASVKYFINYLINNVSSWQPLSGNFHNFFIKSNDFPFNNNSTEKEIDENSGFAIISTKIFLNEDSK